MLLLNGQPFTIGMISFSAIASIAVHFEGAMLFSLSGLPGVGKTTIARSLAVRLSCFHLEIDVIERASREAGHFLAASPDAGYRVAYQVARSVADANLRLGHTVIVDSVNPTPFTRDMWPELASSIGVRFIEVEVVCSDDKERRRRIRASGCPVQHASARWEIVTRNYQVWDRSRLIVDTADATVDDAVNHLWRVANPLNDGTL